MVKLQVASTFLAATAANGDVWVSRGFGWHWERIRLSSPENNPHSLVVAESAGRQYVAILRGTDLVIADVRPHGQPFCVLGYYRRPPPVLPEYRWFSCGHPSYIADVVTPNGIYRLTRRDRDRWVDDTEVVDVSPIPLPLVAGHPVQVAGREVGSVSVAGHGQVSRQLQLWIGRPFRRRFSDIHRWPRGPISFRGYEALASASSP
jgi:hypothetical protein